MRSLALTYVLAIFCLEAIAANSNEKKPIFLTKDESKFQDINRSSKDNEIVLLNFSRAKSQAPYWKAFIPSFNDYISFLKREYYDFVKNKIVFNDKGGATENETNSGKSGRNQNGRSENSEQGFRENKGDKSQEKTSSGYSIPPTRGYIYNGSADRFNYASVDCAAGIMATNKGARSASAILHKDKDRYLLDQCSSKRFVVVELCQEIEVQTLLLSNFEFFSSTFRHFNVYTSSRYPPKEPDGWYLAGSFEALDTRNTQAFDVHLPQVWIKYLKIEFLSHYGDEYYCPISQIKVFGPTMLVEYLDSQERQNKADEHSSEVVPPNSYTVPDDQSLLEKIVSKPVVHDPPKLDLPTPPNSPKVPEAQSTSLPRPSPQCFSPPLNILLPVCKIPLTTPYRHRNRLEELFLPKCSIDAQPSSPSPSESEISCNNQPSYTGTLTQEELPLLTSQASATPGPGTGSENVFRTMARRLDGLESKYALLESYINEQTIALNSILTKMNNQQEQQLLSAFNDLSLRSKQQMEQLKRSHEEVWSGFFHRIESSNSKLRLEVASLNQKVNLLAEEVMFGKRMALAQLTILFIVVVMVVLVQLYYSAFNSKAYLHQPDFGISLPPSPGSLLPSSNHTGRMQGPPSSPMSPIVVSNPGPPSSSLSPAVAPPSRSISPVTVSNQYCNAGPTDVSYQQTYESPELQVSSPLRPISSKSMDDMLLKHSPILQVSSESNQVYTPPCSRDLPLTPPDTSHIEQQPSSFSKDYTDA